MTLREISKLNEKSKVIDYENKIEYTYLCKYKWFIFFLATDIIEQKELGIEVFTINDLLQLNHIRLSII